MSHPLSVNADISDLTTNEVDENGELKPGVPFKVDGTLCDGTAGEYVFGVVIEPTKIVDPNPTNVSLAANTGAVPVAVGVIGIAQRDVIEDNLGRALSANEIAAFGRAGCHLALSRT
jgi:type 1 fimbria pilin